VPLRRWAAFRPPLRSHVLRWGMGQHVSAEVASGIRRRLRALLLRQWKRKRFIARRLIRMGARASTAWRVVYEGRKSLWALSHCGPVDYALDKRYFAKQGLFSLEHHYRETHRVIAPVQLTLALE